MRYLLLLLTIGMAKNIEAQNQFEYFLTDGAYINLVKESSFHNSRAVKNNVPFKYGIGLGYFSEYRMNNTNFITAKLGINYTSSSQKESFRIRQDDINDPEFRYEIEQSRAIFKLNYIGIDFSIQYQYFPFKKIPLLLSFGVKPTFTLLNNSTRKTEHSTWLSVAGATDQDTRSALIDGIHFFENEINLDKHHINYSFGILGFRNHRFKIENVIEVGEIPIKGWYHSISYKRVAVLLNFYYYLNGVTIKNKKYRAKKKKSRRK